MWMPCTKCEHYISCWRNKEYHTPLTPCSEFKEYNPITDNPNGGFIRNQIN